MDLRYVVIYLYGWILKFSGHVIFMGMAEKAVNFFLKSPKLELHQQSLAGGVETYAADFLVDIASGVVRNDNDERLDSLVLAENYKKSSLYAAFRSSTKYLDPSQDPIGENVSTNTSVKSADDSNELNRVLTEGSGSIEGVSMEARSLVSEKSVGSSNSGTASNGSKSQFTSKYMATPMSDASTVVSPYRARSTSRYNSSTYSGTESDDQATMSVDVDNSPTPLQELCGCCVKAGDCIYYSFLMIATVVKEMSSLCHSLTQVDMLLVLYKAGVLWERNFKMFFNRREMIAQSTVTIIGLAVCLGFILGPSSNDYLSVISMFGLGNLCIILTNMQYIRFLFLNNQVSIRTFYCFLVMF
jgi:hypothetical protein